MSIEQLAERVQEMRQAQKGYEQACRQGTREKKLMEQRKEALEKAVDIELKEILHPVDPAQQSLFK